MSYYSTISIPEFKSDYTEEEIREKALEFAQSLDKYTRWWFEDEGGYVFLKDRNEVFLEMDEYYGRHHATEELAKFVSIVIKDDDFVILREDLEDGDGVYEWLISKDKVREIEHVQYVDGMQLDEFLKKNFYEKRIT